MALARQRADWMRTGVAVAWLVNRNGWTRKPIDPLEVIPAPFRPPPAPRRERTPEERAAESRLAWKVLDTYFGRA